MAAAEELGVPLEKMQVVLADTGLTPDDGMTAGSGYHAANDPQHSTGRGGGAKAARESGGTEVGHRRRRDRSRQRQGDAAAIRVAREFGYAELVARRGGCRETRRPKRQTASGLLADRPVASARHARTVRCLARDKVTGAHQFPVGHDSARDVVRRNPASAHLARRSSRPSTLARREGWTMCS